MELNFFAKHVQEYRVSIDIKELKAFAINANLTGFPEMPESGDEDGYLDAVYTWIAEHLMYLQEVMEDENYSSLEDEEFEFSE